MRQSPVSVALPGLAHVEVKVSGVILAPLSNVWSIVRSFANLSSWLAPVNGSSTRSELLRGHADSQIGAVRVITINGHQFAEQLEGLDDLEHTQTYKLISHPGASNPFPYAFLNFHSTLQCKSITVGDRTFMEWTGTFDTDAQGMEEMHARIEDRLVAGFQGLQARLTLNKAPQQGVGMLGGVGSILAPVGIQPMAGFGFQQPQPAQGARGTSSAALHTQHNTMLNTGLMPGGPIDMFLTAEESQLGMRRGPVLPQSQPMLTINRPSTLSGGSTTSQHSHMSASHPSHEDIHSGQGGGQGGQTGQRSSYQDLSDLKSRSG